MTIVKQLLYVYIWHEKDYVYQQRQMIACEIQECCSYGYSRLITNHIEVKTEVLLLRQTM